MLNNKNAKVSSKEKVSRKMLKMIEHYNIKKEKEQRVDQSSDEEALVTENEEPVVHTPEKVEETN